MSRLRGGLRKLEALMIDDRGLIPGSPKWLEHWDRQVYLFMTRQDAHAIDKRPADALWAVLRGAGENPDLLVSTIVGKEDSG
jgi:hypothetical protein